MSDISLSSYIKAARESSGGVIRESSGDGTRLVNKGTLGHWVASHLGMGDEGTRDLRNEAALKGFRQALVDRYGAEISGQALKAVGLDGDDARQLTGGAVLKAAKQAQRTMLENRSGNDDEFRRRRTDGESRLDSELQKRVFRQCYRQEFASQTQYGRVKVEELPDGLEQKTIDRVEAMNDRELAQSLRLRQELGGAMVSLLRSVDRQARTSPLLENMAQIDDRLRDLAEVEHVPPEALDEWRRAMQDYLVHGAMTTIGRADSGILMGAQLKALFDDAPMCAVYAEALALSTEGSEAEQARARRFMSLGESIVGGLARRLGPNSTLVELDLEQLKKGDTVGDDARLGVKAWLKGYSKSVEMNDRVRPRQVEDGNPPTLDEVPPKDLPPKVEQVGQKAPPDQALLRARDQWAELLRKVKPEPEELPSIDEDSENQPDIEDRQKAEEDRRWAVIMRERALKATLDKPIERYMLETGCSLSTAVDLFHDLLLEDEALNDLVDFFDQQTLIDGMVEIEETGLLKEGPRRIAFEGRSAGREQFELEKQLRLQSETSVEMPDKPRFDRQVCYEFYDGLASNVPGIGSDQKERAWDGDGIALARTVARRIGDLVVRLGVDIDTLCDALRSVLSEAQVLPAARSPIEAGLDLVQHPTPGARLVDDLVELFAIRASQDGGWSLEDMALVIAQHVGRLVEKGEMSRDMACVDLAATIRMGGVRHDLSSQAVDDILYLLGQIQQLG